LRQTADLLGDGGSRDAQSLGDPGLCDPAALLLHLVDGFEVLLRSLGDLDRDGLLLHWALSAGAGAQPPSATALLYFADASFLQDRSSHCPPPRRAFLGVPCLLRPGGGGPAHDQR